MNFNPKVLSASGDSKLIFEGRDLLFALNPKQSSKSTGGLEKIEISHLVLAGFSENQKKQYFCN
jgi:hypothetical protein